MPSPSDSSSGDSAVEFDSEDLTGEDGDEAERAAARRGAAAAAQAAELLHQGRPAAAAALLRQGAAEARLAGPSGRKSEVALRRLARRALAAAEVGELLASAPALAVEERNAHVPGAPRAVSPRSDPPPCSLPQLRSLAHGPRAPAPADAAASPADDPDAPPAPPPPGASPARPTPPGEQPVPQHQVAVSSRESSRQLRTPPGLQTPVSPGPGLRSSDGGGGLPGVLRGERTARAEVVAAWATSALELAPGPARRRRASRRQSPSSMPSSAGRRLQAGRAVHAHRQLQQRGRSSSSSASSAPAPSAGSGAAMRHRFPRSSEAGPGWPVEKAALVARIRGLEEQLARAQQSAPSEEGRSDLGLGRRLLTCQELSSGGSSRKAGSERSSRGAPAAAEGGGSAAQRLGGQPALEVTPAPDEGGAGQLAGGGPAAEGEAERLRGKVRELEQALGQDRAGRVALRHSPVQLRATEITTAVSRRISAAASGGGDDALRRELALLRAEQRSREERNRRELERTRRAIEDSLRRSTERIGADCEAAARAQRDWQAERQEWQAQRSALEQQLAALRAERDQWRQDAERLRSGPQGSPERSPATDRELSYSSCGSATGRSGLALRLPGVKPPRQAPRQATIQTPLQRPDQQQPPSFASDATTGSRVVFHQCTCASVAGLFADSELTAHFSEEAAMLKEGKLLVPLSKLQSGTSCAQCWRELLSDASSFLADYHNQHGEFLKGPGGEQQPVVLPRWERPADDTTRGWRECQMHTTVQAPLTQVTKLVERERFALVDTPEGRCIYLHFSNQTPDVMYGDYFRCEALVTITEEQEGCTVQVHGKVHFLKSTMMKGRILSSAIAEMTQCYAAMVEQAQQRLGRGERSSRLRVRPPPLRKVSAAADSPLVSPTGRPEVAALPPPRRSLWQRARDGAAAAARAGGGCCSAAAAAAPGALIAATSRRSATCALLLTLWWLRCVGADVAALPTGPAFADLELYASAARCLAAAAAAESRPGGRELAPLDRACNVTAAGGTVGAVLLGGGGIAPLQENMLAALAAAQGALQILLFTAALVLFTALLAARGRALPS
eukprot:TRINITY_DN24449_c0_g1_i1.p1 TRINITY_DN24449_c0_g1~~TRINITY_DN24449_c0_g1_i1.p1  ORF type:complete len:1101 (+),score=333.36 TRINITY_DN24449_c0_g1_i1:76-3303(+)